MKCEYGEYCENEATAIFQMWKGYCRIGVCHDHAELVTGLFNKPILTYCGESNWDTELRKLVCERLDGVGR